MTAKLLGTIEEIWRYPVSSLGGEQLQWVKLAEHGIVGDRDWCVADAISGQPAAPEKEERWRPALFLRSRLQQELPEIGFPDDTWLGVGDGGLDTKLSEHFGFAVATRPFSHTATIMPGDRPTASNRYLPSPIHLLTTSSLAHLSTLVGTTDIDSRRFRPTIVLRSVVEEGFVEKSWLNDELRLGDATIRIFEETKRCGMTLIAQPGLSENPDILRSILRQNRRNFGVYATILEHGQISIGDEAYLSTD
jgi:uncharacterized protein YcbX